MPERSSRKQLCRILALVLGAYAAVASPAVERAHADPIRPLGTNLVAVSDYSPELPFVNLFLSSRPWLTQCDPERDPSCSWNNAWDTGESRLLNVDSSGWVRSLPARSSAPIFTSAATYWDLPAGFVGGRFVVLYDGTGTIEYGIGAERISSSPGRDLVEARPAQGGILLRITATDPSRTGDYLRNIRVFREGDESRLAATRFSQHFLEQLAPYSALRFMDWMQTNDSPVTSWSDRPMPGDARFSSDKGVPLEVMVDLSNTTGKDPWFTIPHRADDGYVRMFAATVRRLLRSDLTVYVEHSNEVWNSGFSQGGWLEEQAEAAWPGSDESGFTKRMNWHGKRTAEICDTFRAAFAGEESRVVCVLASQAANSWTASEALSCPLWEHGPCASHGIGAVAVAPYFGDYLGQAESYQQVLSWTRMNDGGLQMVFRELSEGGALLGGPTGGAIAQSLDWIAQNRSVAAQFGLPLLAYEGGQHLVGVGWASESEALTALFTRANRDRRMGEAYRRYLDGWNALGGGLFMHFSDIGSYTRYGSWGALESVSQLSSPKYDALKAYALGDAPAPTPTPMPMPTPEQSSPTPTPSPAGDEFALRIFRAIGGDVSDTEGALWCGSACSATYARGSAVTLYPRARRGFSFVRWTGACSHSRRACSISMESNTQVRALFRRRR